MVYLFIDIIQFYSNLNSGTKAYNVGYLVHFVIASERNQKIILNLDMKIHGQNQLNSYRNLKMEKKTLHHALVLKTNKEVAENAFEFGAKFSYKIPTMDEFNEFLDKLSDSEVAQLLYDITVLIEVKSILEDVLNSLLVSRGYTSISYLDQEIKPETKKN